jgi:hypothetical protein
MKTMKIIPSTTCFAEHEKRNLTCEKSNCRMWIDDKSCLNCCILKAREPHTLQEIGDLFGVTRMRICQLEKAILKKVEAQESIIETMPYA